MGLWGWGWLPSLVALCRAVPGPARPSTQDRPCPAAALTAGLLSALPWLAAPPVASRVAEEEVSHRSLSRSVLGLALLGDLGQTLLSSRAPHHPPICGAKHLAPLRGSPHGGLPFPRSGVLWNTMSAQHLAFLELGGSFTSK